jgi:hypothetical protein
MGVEFNTEEGRAGFIRLIATRYEEVEGSD